MVNIEEEDGAFVALELETAEKYLQLRRYLASIGIQVKALSGYRHQKTQERIWHESIANHGEARTRRYVAKPGYSEHETGLALDLTLYDDQGDAVELVVPALVSQGFELLTVNGLTRDRNGMQQGARFYGFR